MLVVIVVVTTTTTQDEFRHGSIANVDGAVNAKTSMLLVVYLLESRKDRSNNLIEPLASNIGDVLFDMCSLVVGHPHQLIPMSFGLNVCCQSVMPNIFLTLLVLVVPVDRLGCSSLSTVYSSIVQPSSKEFVCLLFFYWKIGFMGLLTRWHHDMTCQLNHLDPASAKKIGT